MRPIAETSADTLGHSDRDTRSIISAECTSVAGMPIGSADMPPACITHRVKTAVASSSSGHISSTRVDSPEPRKKSSAAGVPSSDSCEIHVASSASAGSPLSARAAAARFPRGHH